MEYPPDHASFFSVPLDSNFTLQPKDPSTHKPILLSQFLTKKLRWITLGGQYDWTNKVYPPEQPPQFPPDIAQLLHGLFPEMHPQAAIVNFYSPGDTLSLHRDVAEHCDRGLVSISIGCDGIFILGLEDDVQNQEADEHRDKIIKTVAIRLRSGDAVYMDGPSRFAWHGVPQIIPNTCPEWLKEWPAGNDDGQFENWRGWAASKRINLNVRQMWD
jgi:alkylated DNA repair protein alkB family protein 1